MRLLMGLIGFIIFALSLPAASQSSDGKDLARAYFFERTLKSTKKTYACDAITVLAISDKVSIVKGLNEAQNLKLATIDGRTEFTFQRATDAARITSLVESNSIGLCQTLKHQASAKATAAAATQAQLNAALAANNALNNSGGATSGTGGSSGGSRAAGGAATGVAIIGLLKEARSDSKDVKKEEAEIFTSANKQVADLSVARSANALVKPENTAATGSAGTAAVAPSTSPAVAQAQLTSSGPVSMGQADFDFGKRTITINDGPDKGSTYSWSDKEGAYTSPGKANLGVDDMAAKAGVGPEQIEGHKYAAAHDSKAGVAAKETLSSGGASSMDAIADKQLQIMNSAVTEFKTRATAAIQTLQTSGGGVSECVQNAEILNQSVQTYSEGLRSCSDSAIKSEKVCTVSRSPKAQQVSKFMSMASLLLAKENSASNNCKGAGYYAGIAQAGMTMASLTCSGFKLYCDSSCGTATTLLQNVAKAANALLICGESTRAYGVTLTAAMGKMYIAHGNAAIGIAQKFNTVISGEQQPHLGARVTQCQKYSADILDMGIQILSLQQNRKEAKSCKDALARAKAGGKTDGSTNTVADLTMDQFCAQPGQAAVVPCKCRNNNNAEGCPGYVADTLSRDKVTTAGAATSQMGMGGVANMASVGGINGAMAKMNGGKKSGLSAEARAALGISDVANAQGATAGQHSGTAAQGAAGELAAGIETGASGGVAGSNGAAGSDSTTGKKSDGKEKFGKFETIGGGGSFGGFGGFGKFGAEKIDPKTGKKIPVTAQEAAVLVQRKIAAQEFQEQVTTASGKSNWDKVRERYDDAKNSLFDKP